jgi:hypothetical protein
MGTSPVAPGNLGSSWTACTRKKERKGVQDANAQNDETKVYIIALEPVKVLG